LEVLSKYENLINDILFEEIPYRYKEQVIESFKDRYLPLQLNGTIGNNKSFKNNNSAEIVMKHQNTPANV
jgi:hypothetical protein